MVRWLAACAAGMILFLGGMSAASAQGDGCNGEFRDVAVWSGVSFEAGMAASLALRFTETIKADEDGGEAILQLMPWVAGLVGGVTSYCTEWSHEVPTALHGALWTGFDFFLIGAIIDGVDGSKGRLGTGTLVMSSLGVLLGGAFGALALEEGDPESAWTLYFVSAPIAMLTALGAEIVFVLVDFLATGGENFDEVFIPLGAGVLTAGIGTMTLGTLIATDAFADAPAIPGPAAGRLSMPAAPTLALQWRW